MGNEPDLDGQIVGEQSRLPARHAPGLGLAVAAIVLVGGAVGVGAAILADPPGAASLRSTPVTTGPAPASTPSGDLGIFAPVAGWIVYEGRDGIWAVDPAVATDPAPKVRLTP